MSSSPNRWQVISSLMIDGEANPPDAYPPIGFKPSGIWEPFSNYLVMEKEHTWNEFSNRTDTEIVRYDYVLWRRPLIIAPDYNPNEYEED